jgi:hypothetical protein
MHNLAAEPKHAARLKELRNKVQAWMKEQGDEGKVFGNPRLLNKNVRVQP